MSDYDTTALEAHLFPHGNPYAALERVEGLHPAARKKLLRLTVWCEQSKHGVISVFQLREGVLVKCQSDAYVGDVESHGPAGEKWARRRAFFIDEWLANADAAGASHLQIVCRCAQTRPRLVDVSRLIDAIPPEGDTPRNIQIADVYAPDV